ncbi:MAG: uracil-DNA glycosylase family protein [Xenococcaceae cyanobacterium]
MSNLETLIAQIQLEAQKETFPIDEPIYKSAGLDPTFPVLYSGNLNGKLCFFGRDLGKDEVHARQPLIGAAGKLVRQGFFRAIHNRDAQGQKELQTVCDRVLLTNTVPYKPPGNKAYSEEVKARFRPFVERLLVLHWQGNQIITLGTEAFNWYEPYGSKGEVKQFFKEKDKFESKLILILKAVDNLGKEHQKSITLLPLPHPSPLNKLYYHKFPEMLQQRLREIEF